MQATKFYECGSSLLTDATFDNVLFGYFDSRSGMYYLYSSTRSVQVKHDSAIPRLVKEKLGDKAVVLNDDVIASRDFLASITSLEDDGLNIKRIVAGSLSYTVPKSVFNKLKTYLLKKSQEQKEDSGSVIAYSKTGPVTWKCTKNGLTKVTDYYIHTEKYFTYGYSYFTGKIVINKSFLQDLVYLLPNLDETPDSYVFYTPNSAVKIPVLGDFLSGPFIKQLEEAFNKKFIRIPTLGSWIEEKCVLVAYYKYDKSGSVLIGKTTPSPLIRGFHCYNGFSGFADQENPFDSPTFTKLSVKDKEDTEHIFFVNKDALENVAKPGLVDFSPEINELFLQAFQEQSKPVTTSLSESESDSVIAYSELEEDCMQCDKDGFKKTHYYNYKHEDVFTYTYSQPQNGRLIIKKFFLQQVNLVRKELFSQNPRLVFYTPDSKVQVPVVKDFVMQPFILKLEEFLKNKFVWLPSDLEECIDEKCVSAAYYSPDSILYVKTVTGYKYCSVKAVTAPSYSTTFTKLSVKDKDGTHVFFVNKSTLESMKEKSEEKPSLMGLSPHIDDLFRQALQALQEQSEPTPPARPVAISSCIDGIWTCDQFKVTKVKNADVRDYFDFECTTVTNGRCQVYIEKSFLEDMTHVQFTNARLCLFKEAIEVQVPVIPYFDIGMFIDKVEQVFKKNFIELPGLNILIEQSRIPVAYYTHGTMVVHANLGKMKRFVVSTTFIPQSNQCPFEAPTFKSLNVCDKQARKHWLYLNKTGLELSQNLLTPGMLDFDEPEVNNRFIQALIKEALQ